MMATHKNELYEEVLAWAHNAIFNSPSWGLNQLDYSAKSVSVVEMILAELAEKNLSLSDEQMTMISQEYGCYLLIAAHKLYGGEFYWNAEVEQPMLIVGEPQASIVFLTWNKIKGRLLGETQDHIGYFFESFAQDAADPVTGKKIVYM